MQKCKVNKTTCCGYNKETKECNSIENCQHKVVYMDKEEAEEIMKKIKEECDKHDSCNGCAFANICNICFL